MRNRAFTSRQLFPSETNPKPIQLIQEGMLSFETRTRVTLALPGRIYAWKNVASWLRFQSPPKSDNSLAPLTFMMNQLGTAKHHMVPHLF